MIGQFTLLGDINLPDDPQLEAIGPCYQVARMELVPGAILCAAFPTPLAGIRWPRFPKAAQLASGRVATGCGTDLARALRSALGEAAELAQACAWGDEPLFKATPQELGDHAVWPNVFNGFSPAQLADRRGENEWFAGCDWVPPEVSPTRQIAWMWAEDPACGPRVAVPADAVLIGRRKAGNLRAVAVADSTGVACGPTREAARLAALFERVERDAAARWWYGRRTRPTVDPAILSGWPRLLQSLLNRRRVLRLFDVTSDIGIPVMASASFEPDGTAVALGFAAHVQASRAACSAALEMLAVETTLPPWRPPHGPHMLRWLAEAHADCPPLQCAAVAPVPTPLSEADVSETLNLAVKMVRRAGCRVFFLDHSRADWSLPVARAICPELCTLRPRLGQPRLTAYDSRDLAPLLPWQDPVRPVLVPG